MTYIEDFSALGLSDMMLEAVKAKGFETPSPIQSLAIPKLLNQSNDIIAQAQTGTGKTAAFGLPIMDRLEPRQGVVQALILVPTRELALQVTEEMQTFNRQKKLAITAIYGGAAMNEQLRRLAKGVDIVVATPGRCLDHIRRGTLNLSNIEYFILDEADEMLNMGFIEDIEAILSGANENRRVMLFSATMPQRIVALSKKYMRDTEILKVETKRLTTDLTNQIYFEVREGDKIDALTRIIDIEPDFYGIVFGRTKVGVDEIVNRLLERGYSADGLHGDVSQAQREKVLRKFKDHQVNILVATDVAARGIDINNLTHVINYSMPQDSESYVHRIGRTGRAGNEGTAITFISNSEYRRFLSMQREIKVDIKKEQLPSAQDVISMKRAKIKDDLLELIEENSLGEYMDIAQEILQDTAPEVAMSALLKLAFRNDLQESNYAEIRSFTVDRKGTARLFISFGKLDGYDSRKLTDLLKRECGLSDSSIDDIKVMDSYSFATVPFAEAETAIRQLNKLRKGRPVAEIANDKGSHGRSNSEGGRQHRERRRASSAGDVKVAKRKNMNVSTEEVDWDKLSNNNNWDAFDRSPKKREGNAESGENRGRSDSKSTSDRPSRAGGRSSSRSASGSGRAAVSGGKRAPKAKTSTKRPKR